MRRLFHKLKLLTLGLAGTLLFTGFLTVAFSAPAAADVSSAKQQICAGLDATSGSTDSCSSGSGSDINSVLSLAINILSVVVGIIAVIMIVVGGLKYVLSQGESSNVNSAKNTILYAIVGLVIVALAQGIVHFVLTKVPVDSCPSGQTLVNGKCQ